MKWKNGRTEKLKNWRIEELKNWRIKCKMEPRHRSYTARRAKPSRESYVNMYPSAPLGVQSSAPLGVQSSAQTARRAKPRREHECTYPHPSTPLGEHSAPHGVHTKMKFPSGEGCPKGGVGSYSEWRMINTQWNERMEELKNRKMDEWNGEWENDIPLTEGNCVLDCTTSEEEVYTPVFSSRLRSTSSLWAKSSNHFWFIVFNLP